jgi:hypothetical protein
VIKILIDGDITVNLIALRVAKAINLRLHEDNNLYNRVINGTSISITHIVRFTIKIVRIDYNIKAFVMPENVLYFIFLSRPWMRLTKLWDNYEHNQYYMLDGKEN